MDDSTKDNPQIHKLIEEMALISESIKKAIRKRIGILEEVEAVE